MTDRKCGGCSACCVILGVPSIEKPLWVRCEHQCEIGCSIYDQKPDDCGMFDCNWLWGLLDEEDRPDRSGMMFANCEPFVMQVFEVAAGRFNADLVRKAAGFLPADWDFEVFLFGQDGIYINREDLGLMETLIEEDLDD